jgi:hypothetical protein
MGNADLFLESCAENSKRIVRMATSSARSLDQPGLGGAGSAQEERRREKIREEKRAKEEAKVEVKRVEKQKDNMVPPPTHPPPSSPWSASPLEAKAPFGNLHSSRVSTRLHTPTVQVAKW